MRDLARTTETGKKSNKAFMILSAFGILFVIDAHVWTGIAFLTQVFAYDSFFMPMFVFISGYFFKEKHIASFSALWKFIRNKIKTLLLPYSLSIAFYGLLTLCLRKIGLISFGKLSLFTLYESVVTTGTSFGFNDPAWFVPLLFCVCILYSIARKLLQPIWNDLLILILLCLAGAAAVYASKTDFRSDENLMILKTAFFMQFYQLGFVFKKYLEPKFDQMNGFLLCAIMICINLLLIAKYNNISFPNCAMMSGFQTTNYFLPLITSITGISFWLKISKALVPILGSSKLINYISDNTFFIMSHHLLFKVFFSGLLLVGKKWGIACLEGVNYLQFKNSPWYVFADFPWIKVAYFLFTLIFTLIGCKLWGNIKNMLLTLFNNCRNRVLRK